MKGACFLDLLSWTNLYDSRNISFVARLQYKDCHWFLVYIYPKSHFKVILNFIKVCILYAYVYMFATTHINVLGI